MHTEPQHQVDIAMATLKGRGGVGWGMGAVLGPWLSATRNPPGLFGGSALARRLFPIVVVGTAGIVSSPPTELLPPPRCPATSRATTATQRFAFAAR
mmetsp:Transcript_21074/g.45241  ORF Transcript_21074/g.45241 Transcript_21074/m.45241 type:complete len:97 (+) Transcript_21074:243-533(+)